MLKATLKTVKQHARQFERLAERVTTESGITVVPWIAQPGAATFLNRDYRMLDLPDALRGQGRLMFAGGDLVNVTWNRLADLEPFGRNRLAH